MNVGGQVPDPAVIAGVDVRPAMPDLVLEVLAGDVIDLDLPGVVVHRDGDAEIAWIVDGIDLAGHALDHSPAVSAQRLLDPMHEGVLADAGRQRNRWRVDQWGRP